MIAVINYKIIMMGNRIRTESSQNVLGFEKSTSAHLYWPIKIMVRVLLRAMIRVTDRVNRSVKILHADFITLTLTAAK